MTLERLGLRLSVPKSFNFVVHPGMFVGSVLRRGPDACVMANLNWRRADDLHAAARDSESCETQVERGALPQVLAADLYDWRDSLKIPGALFARRFKMC